MSPCSILSRACWVAAGLVASTCFAAAPAYPPVIESQPQSRAVNAGNPVSFVIGVDASPPADIQWYFAGTPISGATNDLYSFVTSSTNQSGPYFAVATNVYGAATSAVATLTVRVQAPIITQQPADRIAVAGGWVQFEPGGYGYPAPLLQWQHDESDIPSATNWFLEIHDVRTDDAGDYTLIAHNDEGAVTSRVARLTVSARGPLDRWHWRRPLPQGNDLWSATFGDGTWVAAGRNGTVLRSTDAGLTWHGTNLGPYYLGSVAYGNGVFVTGGRPERGGFSAILLVSTNAISWIDLSTTVPGWRGAIIGITFGNGRFLAVLNTRDVGLSTNGFDWTWHSTGATAPYAPIFGNGLFFGIYGDYFDNDAGGFWSQVVTSSDGIDWNATEVFTPGSRRNFSYGDGRFVLSGVTNPGGSDARLFTMSSTDGVTWTTNLTTFTNSVTHLAYGGGRWLATESRPWNTLLTSSDLTQWTPEARPLTNEIMVLVHDNGQFLMGGNYGNFLSSSNGSDWMVHSSGSPDNLRAVARGNNVTVAIGNDGLMFTSTDHLTWTRRNPGTNENLRGIVWGRERFVVVGNDGVILVSTNGESWSPVPSPTANGFFSVAFSGETFVAAGENGVIAWSSDGLTWSNAVSGTSARLNVVTWTGDRFLVVGRNRTIRSSPDGREWSGATFEGSSIPFFQGVAAGNDRFVAVGQGGRMYVSTNGVDWLENAEFRTALGAFDLEDLAFAGGLFIACGENGTLATSPDGWTWTEHFIGCRNDLRGIRWLDGHLLAVGNNETIIESDFFGPPRLHARPLLAGVGFVFSIETEAGQTCRLESSEDLVQWEEVLTFSRPDGSTLFLDQEALQLSARFFRVVVP